MMMLHWEENEPRWGLLATRQPPYQPPTMPWGGGNQSTATNIGDSHGLRRQELGDGNVMARAELPKGDHSPSKARMSHPNWGNLTCRVCDKAMTTPMEG